MSAVADRGGGREERAPPVQIFFHFHAVFGEKLCQIIGWQTLPHPRDLRLPSGKSWICHWSVLYVCLSVCLSDLRGLYLSLCSRASRRSRLLRSTSVSPVDSSPAALQHTTCRCTNMQQKTSMVTARKRSSGKVMFLLMFVCPHGRICLPTMP